MTVEFQRIEEGPKIRKNAVVFFTKKGELHYRNGEGVSQQSSRACGKCIDEQVLSLSKDGKPVVIDLTGVADCMALALASVRYGKPPRGLYVSARNDLCPGLSAESAACSGLGGNYLPGHALYGREVDGALPAQTFESGHVVANVGYDYNPEIRGEKEGMEELKGKVPQFQLFYAVLPQAATPRKRKGPP